MPWTDVLHAARGTTVRYAMWSGDEARNRFYQGAATEALRQDFGITLKIVPLRDTADLINKLLNEKAAGVAAGSVDVVWINGENFRTARQGGLLWGPFADGLPNIRYFDDEARRQDFGTTTDGFEAPYQQAQFAFAYDSARLRSHRSRSTNYAAGLPLIPGASPIRAIPDFTGSAFIRHVLMHSGDGAAGAVRRTVRRRRSTTRHPRKRSRFFAT